MKDQVVEGEETYNCLLAPDTITAFSAYIAYDDVPANCDVFEPVYVLNADSSNLPVPIA